MSPGAAQNLQSTHSDSGSKSRRLMPGLSLENSLSGGALGGGVARENADRNFGIQTDSGSRPTAWGNRCLLSG